MGEVAEYFKREKYITRRLSLLALGGTILLVPIAFASAHGRVPVHALEWAMFVYVVFVAFAVVLIVRAAHAKFPKSNRPDDSPLDDATRRKLRRRIWMLQFFVVFYAVGLVHALAQAGKGPWLPLAIGAAISLLIEVVLIKAIRRLKRKLRVAAGALTSQNAGAMSRAD
jgi:Ca2+/Na+ antiporter